MTTSVPYVALDRANDPSVLIDALRFANDWTARIDFTNTSTVRAQLEATNAFAEEGGTERLLLPPFRHFVAARRKNRYATSLSNSRRAAALIFNTNRRAARPCSIHSLTMTLEWTTYLALSCNSTKPDAIQYVIRDESLGH